LGTAAIHGRFRFVLQDRLPGGAEQGPPARTDRPFSGLPRTVRSAMAAVHRAGFAPRWRKDAGELRQTRQRPENTAGAGDLKHGPGGIVDTEFEFLVQMLQLRHARKKRTRQIRERFQAAFDAAGK
jgi:glutamine synthetase adenylyltransferase